MRVGLGVVGILVTAGNETTTHGNDVVLATRVRIGSLVPMGFEFFVIPTLDVTGYLVPGTLFWGSVIILGRTISTRVLPLLKRIKV